MCKEIKEHNEIFYDYLALVKQLKQFVWALLGSTINLLAEGGIVLGLWGWNVKQHNI